MKIDISLSPDLEIGPFLGYDMGLLRGGAGPAGGSGSLDYWVLEEDGTSKWTLEEANGFWKTEESI